MLATHAIESIANPLKMFLCAVCQGRVMQGQSHARTLADQVDIEKSCTCLGRTASQVPLAASAVQILGHGSQAETVLGLTLKQRQSRW